MKNSSLCLVCNSTNIQNIYNFQDYKLKRCNKCGLQFLDPLPAYAEMEKLYRKSYFLNKEFGVRGYKDYGKLCSFLVHEAYKKLSYIKKFTKAKKILDIGAGTGIFLDIAQKQGYQIAGNDISQFALGALKRKRIKYFAGSLDKADFPSNGFDIVTAWDVIEHIITLTESIKNVYKTLRKGGYFFLTTPTTDSIDAKLLRKNWYGYKKIPEHIVFFNNTSIINLLSNNGFQVVNISRWGFIRDLEFISDRLFVYSRLFDTVKKLLILLKLSKITIFFPFTDFMVVAKKV